jgi:predicted SAM-dependent methyltransferase
MSLALRNLAGQADLKLQLGCGANVLPGWINTDVMPAGGVDHLDFTKPLPCADNSIAAIFCEHTIEHITKTDALRLLKEIFRILKRGAYLRIVTPSLENFCRFVLEPNTEAATKYLDFSRRYSKNPNASMSDAINRIFYEHGHRHIYSITELGKMLGDVGFAPVLGMAAGSYHFPVFHGVDGHGKVIGEDINAIEAFAVEARKP